jgi:hypothetical protein
VHLGTTPTPDALGPDRGAALSATIADRSNPMPLGAHEAPGGFCL